MKMKRYGSVEALEIPGETGGPCVIVFHGFGADATDLYSLGSVIKGPPGTTWIFPNGIQAAEFQGGTYGRAWFPIDVEALEAARAAGTHSDFSQATPPGMKKAREAALSMIDALRRPYSKIVLAGFSQGAMLATDLALRAPEKPAGLIILSGALLDEKLWTEKAKAKPGMTFYQSHGIYDELLDVENAKRLEKILVSAGWKGKLQLFNGGHEIPQEVIHQAARYVNQSLARS